MTELINFYKNSLGCENYYELIISNSKLIPNEFNQNKQFLEGIKSKDDLTYKEFSTQSGDDRIDVPVWFGHLDKAEKKIIVFGLEPRDTNKMFNIERVNHSVFGTPFGVDRWNFNSSVPRKPHNRYYRVFKEISERPETFLLFSDIVKYYKVIDNLNTSRINDIYARSKFFELAYQSKEKLIKEIEIVDPTHGCIPNCRAMQSFSI